MQWDGSKPHLLRRPFVTYPAEARSGGAFRPPPMFLCLTRRSFAGILTDREDSDGRSRQPLHPHQRPISAIVRFSCEVKSAGTKAPVQRLMIRTNLGDMPCADIR